MASRFLLTALAVLFAALPAQAQLLLEENFDYDVGTTLTDNGWTGVNSGAPVAVTDGGLSFPDYPSVSGNAAQVTGVNNQEAFRLYQSPAQQSGTVYAAALVNVASATTGGDYFMTLNASSGGSSLFSRLYARLNSSTNALEFGFSKGSAAGVYSSDAFAFNTTYLVVLKYQFVADGTTNDISGVYVFEAGDDYSAEPASLFLSGTGNDASSLASVFLRQTASTPSAVVDGIRVGYTWADLFPSESDPAFTFTRPEAGQTFAIGNPLKAIWDSEAGTEDATVELSLCLSGVCDAPHYTGPNLAPNQFGLARLIIPSGTTPSSEYTLQLCVQGDPSTCAVSPEFTIFDRDEVFVVSAPGMAAFGMPAAITWTSPPSAPAGDVTITVTSFDGATTFQTLPTANDGEESLTLDPSVVFGHYRVSVCPEDGPETFCGRSARMSARAAVVTAPVAGTVLTPTGVVTVEWQAMACDSPTATADIYLRRSSGGRVQLIDDTDCDGAADVTIPGGAVGGDDYFIQVQVFDGESRIVVANSGALHVSDPQAGPVVGTTRFAMPVVSGVADAFVRVVTPGLADGSEVAVSAGSLVLGTGVVRAGAAEVVLFSAVADPTLLLDLTAEEAMEYVAEGAALTVTTWDARSGEQIAEVASVMNAEGRSLSSLAFATGSDLTVTLKGGTASESDAAFALTGIAPNPTSGTATVRFTLPASQAATVTVYDLLGRVVATVFEGTATAGANEVRVPALTAGVYVVRVSTEGASATSRFTVVR